MTHRNVGSPQETFPNVVTSSACLYVNGACSMTPHTDGKSELQVVLAFRSLHPLPNKGKVAAAYNCGDGTHRHIKHAGQNPFMQGANAFVSATSAYAIDWSEHSLTGMTNTDSIQCPVCSLCSYVMDKEELDEDLTQSRRLLRTASKLTRRRRSYCFRRAFYD